MDWNRLSKILLMQAAGIGAHPSINLWLVEAWFVPPELAASYPLPAFEGREWKYFAETNGWSLSNRQHALRSPFAGQRFLDCFRHHYI
jgi:hypothetical protein